MPSRVKILTDDAAVITTVAALKRALADVPDDIEISCLVNDTDPNYELIVALCENVPSEGLFPFLVLEGFSDEI